MGKPQLGGQIFPLAIKHCTALFHFTVEISELLAHHGQLPPGAGQLSAQSAGLIFRRAQLLIEIRTFRLIATSLAFEATNLLAYSGQFVLGLAASRAFSRLS
jgi:hypothetical protein